MPLVDVVIPAYNAAPYVREAVGRALAEDVDLRVIVVDDGSSDGTLDAVPDDPRVVKLRQENRGVAAARNAGIAAGTSPFVALLDADDRWRPGKLAAQVAALERAGPGAALSFTDFVEFEDGRPPRSEPVLAPRGAARGGRVLDDLLAEQFVKTSTVLLRRTALPGSRPFDESLRCCEDRDLFYRLAEHHDLLFDPRVTTEVRLHASSITAAASALLAARVAAHELALRRLARTPHRRAAEAALAARLLDLAHARTPGDVRGAVRACVSALRHGGGRPALRLLAAAIVRGALALLARRAAA